MAKQSKESEKKIYRSTFTYFIPSPPLRKSGYREVEFDKIMKGILEIGFEIDNLQTVPTTHGIYIIIILKTQNKKVLQLDLKLDMHENFKLTHTHSSPEIILDEE